MDGKGDEMGLFQTLSIFGSEQFRGFLDDRAVSDHLGCHDIVCGDVLEPWSQAVTKQF